MVFVLTLCCPKMDPGLIRHIGRSCPMPRLPSDVYQRVRELGIQRPPTKRGTRAGRLHRLWHGLPPAAPAAAMAPRPWAFLPESPAQPSGAALLRPRHVSPAPPSDVASLPLPDVSPALPPDVSPLSLFDVTTVGALTLPPDVNPALPTDVTPALPFDVAPALPSDVSSAPPPDGVDSNISLSHTSPLHPGLYDACTASSPSRVACQERSLNDSCTSNVTRSKDLRLCHLNSQSAVKSGKPEAISDFILEQDLDVMFLTETWLSDSGHEATCKMLTPSGYCLKSCPRPSRGGGIAVVFRQSLEPHVTFRTTVPYEHSTFEVVEMVITCSGTSTCMICIYRPPPNTKNKFTFSTFLIEIENMLEHHNTHTPNTVIIGDFNIPFDKPQNNDTKQTIDLLDCHGLKQLVDKPTRKTHIIDWIVTHESTDLVYGVLLNDYLRSDHSAVLFSLKVLKPPKQKKRVVRRNLKEINTDTFRAEAARRLLDRPTSSDPVPHYDSTLRTLLDEHAPAKTKLIVDRPSAPWMSSEVKTAKQARRRAERKWRTSKLEVDRQIYNKHKEHVQTIIADAKQSHYSTKICETTSSKALFSTMNDLLGCSSASPLPNNIDSSKLSQAFSEYFHNKIQAIRDKLDNIPYQSSDTPPAFTGTPFTHFKPLTLSELEKVIKDITLKTCDLDPLPTQLYSDCLPELLPSILEIINNSLQTGTVPDSFKTAIVKPLLKKPSLDPNILSNFRPVSNLSFISKLLERIVLNQLNSHLLCHNLLSPLQSAYRPNHSTETALLKITNDLLSATDQGEISALALLDLSAAFDTVDHNILLQRLQHTFGIHSTALSWFSSYLTNRYQTVSIDNLNSDPIKLECGVPQGSVLGPVLFTLYTQPLDHIFDRHNVLHHSFADDSQLHNNSTPDQSESLLSTLSDTVTDVQNWMTENKLQLNSNKTEAILIGTTSKLSKATSDSLELSDSSVPLSSSVKNLGVTLDKTLSMKKHISSVTSTCYFHLRRIATIRKYLTTDATAKLVTSTILSRLDYCNSLLAGLPSTSISRLQRIQNSSARLVLKKKKRDHITPMLQQLHWLPVSTRIKYKLNTLTYKCLNNLAPSYLSDSLSFYQPSRPLRSSHDNLKLNIPTTKLKTAGQRSFSFQAPTHWNSLPLALRQQQSLESFKSGLKTFLFQK